MTMEEQGQAEEGLTILQVFNKYQFPGGEEASVMRVADTLEARHRVIRCYYESSEWAEKSGPGARFLQGARMLYNREVIREVIGRIKAENPDVILLHNLFPVCSSGLLWRLSRLGIPMVQYVHNFRPFSVNGYCWARGRICDAGRRLNYLPEVVAGSWQGSRIKTAWYALNLWLLHLSGAYRRVSKWIAISDFMAGYFRAAGIEDSRVVSLRHSWNALAAGDVAGYRTEGANHFLFLGRLTEEKGIPVLIEAWKLAEGRCNGAELVIAGDGPLRQWVEDQARRIRGVRYLGHVAGDEKRRLLAGASAVVVPSIWWEPLGLVVYEAYDNEVPVLAARSGGLTETVSHGETGWLHEPGNAGELADHLVRIAEDREGAASLGRAGRKFLLREADPGRWSREINRHLAEVVVAGRSDTGPASKDRRLRVLTYLADQNPKLGRSLGISRMTEVVLDALGEREDVELGAMVSTSSVQGPVTASSVTRVAWSTRNSIMRVVTDNLHPLLRHPARRPDVWYFPKGFMPRLQVGCRPAVATIHDTIIQYYQDRYPKWRLEAEYNYWAGMLRNTLVNAAAVMTVSEHAKGQIEDFIRRHRLPEREIFVTYEPCLYESIPQPEEPAKADYVLHLGSVEPHKRTAWLVRLWAEAVRSGREMPRLHVVGRLPENVSDLVEEIQEIVHLPFLEDRALVSQFTAARALVFPSEVEGFGLPAIEAYYLGTPTCFTLGTSMQEVLAPATAKGGFSLADPESLWSALDEVLEMSAAEVRTCGLTLREEYDSKRVVERMMEVFTGARAED